MLYVWCYRRSRDAAFLGILILSMALRLLLGYLNQRIGPFPGAEVDAIVYESTANQIATGLVEEGRFYVEFGQRGYSSILAIPYALGGRLTILPTLVNSLFITHFLFIVYQISLRFAPVRRARLITFVAALYPTSLLFASIPVREAPLMWGLALWLDGIISFLQDQKRIWNTRVVVGSFLAFWLHSAFFILYFLTFFAWWRKRPVRPHFTRIGSRFPRFVGFVLGTTLAVAAFLAIGGILQKIPDDPSQIASAEFLSRMRASKAERTETPYGSIVPSSWPGLVVSLPLLLYKFLLVPTPLAALRSGSLQELLKSIDSISFFFMSGAAIVSIRRARLSPNRSLAVTVGVILICLLLLFSVGSASVGIAMRHRAKFAWLLILLIGVFFRKEAYVGATMPQSIPSQEPVPPQLQVAN